MPLAGSVERKVKSRNQNFLRKGSLPTSLPGLKDVPFNEPIQNKPNQIPESPIRGNFIEKKFSFLVLSLSLT